MNYKRLIISLLIPQMAGLAGSFFASSAVSVWYINLQKPFFNPPSWIFGPVWIFLYVLMGISIYLIWSALDKTVREKNIKNAMKIFWIHLFFNAVWSIIFFGLRSPGWAMIDIVIIWLFIIILIIKFWKINKWAAYLLAPYFLWVSFASILNYFIWHLN